MKRPHLHVNWILDRGCAPRARALRYLHDVMWLEALEDLAKIGINIEVAGRRDGFVHRPPDEPPALEGLMRDSINIVVTRRIPMHWDRGRALKGIAFHAYGYDVCVLALDNAHAFRFPYLANNTIVHELLHFALDDVREVKPRGLAGEWREFSVEALATHLHRLPPVSFIVPHGAQLA